MTSYLMTHCAHCAHRLYTSGLPVSANMRLNGYNGSESSWPAGNATALPPARDDAEAREPAAAGAWAVGLAMRRPCGPSYCRVQAEAALRPSRSSLPLQQVGDLRLCCRLC
jgi:hypothetical protein